MRQKLNPRKILSLVEKAATGIDNLPEGAIGSSGFGFLFRDEKYLPKGIKFCGGGKIYNLGSMKEFAIEYEKRSKANELPNLYPSPSDFESFNQDFYIIGSIKTLVPNLTFGDPALQDSLFDIWMFVKTADGKMFPARLYYGQTYLAIGEWGFKRTRNSKLAIEFENLVNYEPRNLSIEEKRALVEAIELALMKVPVSDFLGIHSHDFGYTLMGIHEGKLLQLYAKNISDLDFLLFLKGYEIKNKRLVKRESPESRESEGIDIEDSKLDEKELEDSDDFVSDYDNIDEKRFKEIFDELEGKDKD